MVSTVWIDDDQSEQGVVWTHYQPEIPNVDLAIPFGSEYYLGGPEHIRLNPFRQVLVKPTGLLPLVPFQARGIPMGTHMCQNQ